MADVRSLVSWSKVMCMTHPSSLHGLSLYSTSPETILCSPHNFSCGQRSLPTLTSAALTHVLPFDERLFTG